jgi:hypothetical protein
MQPMSGARRAAFDRAVWLRGLAVGDPVRVVLPAEGGAVEHTRVTVVRPSTIEVAGRYTSFARGTGLARGANPATGPCLEREEGA